MWVFKTLYGLLRVNTTAAVSFILVWNHCQQIWSMFSTVVRTVVRNIGYILCTYASMHLCTYATMHLHLCTYAPMQLCTCTYAPMHLYLCTYTNAPIHMHLHTSTYTPTHRCTYTPPPTHLHTSTPKSPVV
jgi:hypothetical protein